MKGLKGILCNIFHNVLPETEFNALEFSTCLIMLPLKMFQVLEHFVFKFIDFVFFELGIPNLKQVTAWLN